jgi:hypothetical protein
VTQYEEGKKFFIKRKTEKENALVMKSKSIHLRELSLAKLLLGGGGRRQWEEEKKKIEMKK